MPDLPVPTPPPSFARGDIVTLKANTPCPEDWRPHVWQHFLGQRWTVTRHDEEAGDYLLSWTNDIGTLTTTVRVEAMAHV